MSLLDFIDAYLVAPKHIIGERPRIAHYPSEVSCIRTDTNEVIGGCLRNQYWSWKGEPETNPMDAGGWWVTTMGKLIEKQVMDWLRQMNVLIGTSVKFYNKDLNISGEADGFCWNFTVENGFPTIIKPRGYIGLEIKSAYAWKFAYAISKEPNLEHVLQVLCYLKEFIKVKLFKLIYVARDNPREARAEYNITMDDFGHPVVNGVKYKWVSIQGIEDRWFALTEYLNTNKLPPRDYILYYPDEKIEKLFSQDKLSKKKYNQWKKGEGIPSDWVCLYCSRKTLCWPNAYKDYERRTQEKKLAYKKGG